MEREKLLKINKCILQIAQGNISALDELFLLVGRRLLSISFGVLKNKSDAEDCLSECFIKVVKHAKKFKKETNGYGWLCKIAQNTALNIYKQKKNKQNANIDDCYDLSNNVDESCLSDYQMTIKEALNKLDKQVRRAIYLKFFEELTVREIASVLQTSKSTADRLIQKGMSQLKDILKDWDK